MGVVLLRPREEPENLYFEDSTKSADGISTSTNIDWYNPKFRPRKTEPAVEILS
jgi:hypothetical protein